MLKNIPHYHLLHYNTFTFNTAKRMQDFEGEAESLRANLGEEAKSEKIKTIFNLSKQVVTNEFKFPEDQQKPISLDSENYLLVFL